MEQDRIYPTITGAGYRLAAPALRTKQRLQGGQSSLDFPARDAAGLGRGSGQDSAGRDGEDGEWGAAEDDPGLWGSGFRLPFPVSGSASIPWRDCLVVARHAAVIGAMGCAGFALVLYASQPRPPGHDRVAQADRVALAENLPQAVEPQQASPQPASPKRVGPQETARETAGPTSIQALDPAPSQASSAPPVPASPRDMAPPPPSIPAPAMLAAASPPPSPAPPAVASSSATDEEAAPSEAAAPLIGPTAPLRVRSPAPARAAMPMPMPMLAPGQAPGQRPGQAPGQRPGQVQTASIAGNAAERNGASHAHAYAPRLASHAPPPALLAARAKDRVAPERFALPGWLTASRPSRPKVLVMSQPPHSLTPPPGMLAEPAPAAPLVVRAMALPPLRQPVTPRYANATPYGSGYGYYYGYRSPYWQPPAPPSSGIYYGAPGVPPPQPGY